MRSGTYRVPVTGDGAHQLGGVDPGASPWAPVEPAGAPGPELVWTSPPAALAGPAAGRRRGGVRTAAAIVAVLACALGVVAVVGPHLASTGHAYRLAVASGAAAPGSVAGPGQGARPDDRDQQIAALLARRGAAVTGDDAAAYARTQTAGALTPLFARLAALPLTVWDYRVLSTVEQGPAAVQLDVRLHLRLDADTTDAVVHEHVTLARDASGWRVSAEATADRRAQPWDLGTLTVVHGSRSLVIGVDTPVSALRGYARLADAAVPAVSAVWGAGWSQRPVVLVPATTAQLGRALARTAASLDGYAAVTTGELSDGGDRSTSALRVWLNTPGMAPLSAVGRQVVIRHEITHVATDAPGTPGVPLWLEEGFAEYVGYRDSGIALGDELRELVAAARSGHGPDTLPTRATFQGQQVDIAYEGGDLACRVLADRYGQKGLVEVYRLTAAGTGTEAQNLDAALREVTLSGTAALEASWRARLRLLAG